jgi:dihydroflavonol-4-reductase
MARYLVTGGTGFLGSHLIAALRAQGQDVIALCRTPSPELAKLGATVAMGDVLDAASVEAAAAGCAGLFHCAGLVSREAKDSDAMMRVHVQGTRIALDAAKKAGIKRAVVASTSGTVAVSAEDRTMSEDDETPHGLIARWPYYRSKLFAEQEAFRRNVEGFAVISVNPALLLGPGDTRGSSTDDVRLFLEKKVQAVPAGGMSFVDARDAAGAMIAAMERGRPGQRYLVSGCNCTVREFFGRLERLSGVKAPWLPMPKSPELAKQAVRFLDRVVEKFGGTQSVSAETVDVAQHFWYVNWSKAERELGFKPRDPTATLRDTIDDLRLRGVVWPGPRKASQA